MILLRSIVTNQVYNANAKYITITNILNHCQGE